MGNQAALVTGAGRGVGRPIAIRFGGEGASGIAADWDARNAEATAVEIVASRGNAQSAPADFEDLWQVEALVAAVIEDWSKIDLLVNVDLVGLTKLFQPRFGCDFRITSNENE